ncbi:MAG: phosphotransferase [Dehalococcoidia bacterium]
MGKLSIPRSPQEISPEWLTAALRDNDVIREANVVSVASESIGAGAGFLGQLARITVTYDRDEAGAPTAMVAKLPALDPGGRGVANLFRFYEREIRFYEDIAADVNMSVPKRYYSAMDVEGDEYLLLIEDMAPAVVGDEAPGCAAEQAELAISSLAKFQAAWWNSPKLDKLDWMPAVNGPVQQVAAGAYQQAWGTFCQFAGDKLSPALVKLGEQLQHHVLDVLDALAPAPLTIIHGDFRGDNVFYGDGVSTPAFRAIDWQISCKGRGVFDVAYFLSTSVTPEVRKAHEERLVRLWHDIISDQNDTKDYTYDDAFYDYRLSALFMHVYTVVAIGSLDSANERGLFLFNEWLRRRATAIEELSCDELTAKVFK